MGRFVRYQPVTVTSTRCLKSKVRILHTCRRVFSSATANSERCREASLCIMDRPKPVRVLSMMLFEPRLLHLTCAKGNHSLSRVIYFLSRNDTCETHTGTSVHVGSLCEEWFCKKIGRRFCRKFQDDVRFQVLTAASMMFRIVFWDVLPCKLLSTDVSEVRTASIIRDYVTRRRTVHTIEGFLGQEPESKHLVHNKDTPR
jgi:hypothetical protein